MSNYEKKLIQLHNNLNILCEREAKYGGNAPLDLLNQIEDHRKAVTVTEQVIAGEISEVEWHEASKSLLAFTEGRVINVEAETYIAGDQITHIHEALEEPSFWRRLSRANLLLAIIVGLFSIIGAIAAVLAVPGASDYAYSFFTPPAFSPASDNETLIVIATFHHSEGVTDTEPHYKIKRALEQATQKIGLKTLRVEVEPTVLPADHRAEAEVLGHQYNATIIIWGEDTGVQVLVNFLNLKQPEFRAAEVVINETFRTQLRNPDAYSSFIVLDLPGQLSFLALYTVAQSYFSTEDYQKAEEIIKYGIDSLVDDAKPEGLAEAYFDLGWINLGQIKEGSLPDYEKAIINFSKVIELQPEFIHAYGNRGLSYTFLGEYEKALSDFSKIIELSPEEIRAYADRGHTYYILGEYEKSLADFNKAIELDPDNPWGYGSRGAAYGNLGEYEKALADLDKAIELDPKLAWAYNSRGAAYSQLGEYEKSLADFNKAIELNPDDALAYVSRGETYRNLGEYEKSLADFNKAIELNPDDALGYGSRGETYRNLGEYEKSLADFNKAIELNPDDASGYGSRGETYRNLGEYEKALADFNKAIELDPDDALGYGSRGETYRNLGEYEKALTDLDKAIELDPKFTWAYHNRASTYVQLKEYRKALTDFNKEIELDPENTWAYYSRGYTYLQLKEYEQALVDFERVMELDPENPNTLSSVCWNGSLYGLAENVMAACNQAVELAPKAGYIRGSRGLARALTGDRVGAIEDFEFASKWWQENDPSAPWAGLVAEWVEMLETGNNPFDEETLERLRKGIEG